MTAQPHAVITGTANAFPDAVRQEKLWRGFFAAHVGNRRAAEVAFASAGVQSRHAALNPLMEDVSRWSTAKRMERYALEAMPLGRDAIVRALDAAGLAPSEIGLLAVASCTGYATPGIDIRLARDLGMAESLQRLSIGHVGCHAALPSLGVVSDYVRARREPGLLLCLELSSLHIQPPSRDLEQVIVHALFSDAACAFVVAPESAPSTRRSAADGLLVLDLVARTDSSTSEMMTWTITDLGFRMTLSRHVPQVIAREVVPLVDELLSRNRLSRSDVNGWAVHPGGPRILEVVGEQLSLPTAALDNSRKVLFEHGNCSSATILLAIDSLRTELEGRPGSTIVALAFGPGLTMYAMLLQTVEI